MMNMLKFDTIHEQKIYNTFVDEVIRDFRSWIYARAKDIPMQNQEFFMNILITDVKYSEQDNLTSIYFYAHSKLYYLIYKEDTEDIIISDKRNRVIFRSKGRELTSLTEPLQPNKFEQIAKVDPLAKFLSIHLPKWIRHVKSLKHILKFD